MLMNQNIPEEGSKVYSATLDPLAKLYGYTFSEKLRPINSRHGNPRPRDLRSGSAL